MPITKHHKKKYPNSEWVRRRNIRSANQKRALKPSSSEPLVAMETLKKSTKSVRSQQPTTKRKSLFQGIKNVFATAKRNSNDAA